MSKLKNQIEYRYYEIPADHYCLALLGDTWVRNYGEATNTLHFHNYLEIGYCYWGSGRLTIEEKSMQYKGGEITLIPKNIPHTTKSDGDEGVCKWEFLFIDLDNFIRHEMQFKRLDIEEVIKTLNAQSYVILAAQNPQLNNLVKGIIEEYRSKKPHYKNAVKGYLRALVVEMLRTNESMSSNLTLDESRVNNYIEQSVNYIETHFAEDIRLEDIATNCGLSESHFRRIFVDSIGMKPSDYLNMIRVNKACEYMMNEDVSVEEIGYRVGFQNPSTFNRNFKKIIGTTPFQWKKEENNNSGIIRKLKISAKKGW